MAAAGGVWATGTGWLDLIVGFVIASMAVTASVQVLRRAVAELKIR
jgi:Co/Zn/Cd efflux system component